MGLYIGLICEMPTSYHSHSRTRFVHNQYTLFLILLTSILTSVRAFGESSKHFNANSFPVVILLHNLKRDTDITTAVTIYCFAFVISVHELNIDCI